MLMCRSPFQGLLFIYTSQSQPPRCQPGLWRGTHTQREGEAVEEEEEGGRREEEGTLGNRVGWCRDGGVVFLLVKRVTG